MTLPEVLLWRALRRGGVAELRFRRQHPTGRYILDFYCAALKLAIEVDGAVHDNPGQIRHDVERDSWLTDITVLRFNASDVLKEERRQHFLAP